jgi:hypothetical protein
MKLIEELKINKDLFENFKDSKIKVKKLYVNVNNDDIFYYNNLDFFINNNFIKEVLHVARFHGLKLTNEKNKEIKNIIIDFNDPYYLVLYAEDVLIGRRWIYDNSLSLFKRKAIEETIASKESTMYKYALDIINGRWKEKEKNFAESSVYVAEYAVKILKERWTNVKDINSKIAKKAERNILKKSGPALSSYLIVVKDRWKEFEDNIKKIDPYVVRNYLEKIEIRIPELEDYFSKNKQIVIFYSEIILKKPWNQMKDIIDDKIIKQAEDTIHSNNDMSIKYAINVLKKRLPLEIENKILNDYNTAYSLEYVKEVIKKRSLEFEKNLIKLKKEIDKDNLTDYLNNLYPEDNILGEDIPNNKAPFILYTIYQYAKDIIKGPWPEVEINNKDDLKKLRKKIIELDVMEFLDELRYEDENEDEN